MNVEHKSYQNEDTNLLDIQRLTSNTLPTVTNFLEKESACCQGNLLRDLRDSRIVRNAKPRSSWNGDFSCSGSCEKSLLLMRSKGRAESRSDESACTNTTSSIRRRTGIPALLPFKTRQSKQEQGQKQNVHFKNTVLVREYPIISGATPLTNLGVPTGGSCSSIYWTYTDLPAVPLKTSHRRNGESQMSWRQQQQREQIVRRVGIEIAAAMRRSSSNICPKQQQEQEQHGKHVRFSSLVVREYPIILGDTPATKFGGPGLSIDWTYTDLPAIPLNSFETARSTHRRTGNKLLLDRQQREKIVRQLGYSEREIAAAVRSGNMIRAQRRQTANNMFMDEACSRVLNGATKRMRGLLGHGGERR